MMYTIFRLHLNILIYYHIFNITFNRTWFVNIIGGSCWGGVGQPANSYRNPWCLLRVDTNTTAESGLKNETYEESATLVLANANFTFKKSGLSHVLLFPSSIGNGEYTLYNWSILHIHWTQLKLTTLIKLNVT